MPYPRFQRARNFKYVTRTAGDISIVHPGWMLPTTAMDMTLEAQSGDVVEYGINGVWGTQNFGGFLDVVTMVSGSPVNYFFSAGNSSNAGAFGWWGVAATNAQISGSVMYTVQTGDLASGTVTLRISGALSGATTGQSRTILASSGNPLHLWAKNLGPVQPN